MTGVGRVGLRALDLGVVVEADAKDRRVVERLFEPLLADPGRGGVTYGLDRLDGGEQPRVRLRFEDEVLVDDGPLGACLAHLVWHLNEQVRRHGAGHRHLLHAAAASRDGRAVLLPGASGAGKSTLVAGLVRSGLDYLGDEMIVLGRSSGEVHGYAKPIALDQRGWEAVSSLDGPEVPDPGATGWLIGSVGLGTGRTITSGEVVAIVLPRFRRDEATVLERLERADAFVALLASSFAPSQIGAVDPGALARLVARASCHRLEGGSLRTACDGLVALLEEPVVPGTVRTTAAQSVPGSRQPAVSPGATLVELDGEGVVLDERGGVHRLNPSACALWHLLDGTRDVGALRADADRPGDDLLAAEELERFIEDLRIAGLLTERGPSTAQRGSWYHAGP